MPSRVVGSGAAAPLRVPAPLQKKPDAEGRWGCDSGTGRLAGQRDEQEEGAEAGPPRPASLPSEFKSITAENTGLPSGLQKQG